jgi:hypothetical protein
VRLSKAENDRRIDDHKYESYYAHVQALKEEKEVIAKYGPMSVEAADAEKHSRKTRRNWELWRKK